MSLYTVSSFNWHHCGNLKESFCQTPGTCDWSKTQCKIEVKQCLETLINWLNSYMWRLEKTPHFLRSSAEHGSHSWTGCRDDTKRLKGWWEVECWRNCVGVDGGRETHPKAFRVLSWASQGTLSQLSVLAFLRPLHDCLRHVLHWSKKSFSTHTYYSNG